MTEAAVRQSPSVAAVASQVHSSWRVTTESTPETLPTSTERRRTSNGGIPGNVPVSIFQNSEPPKMLFERNINSPSHDERTNPFETRDITREDFASSSDDYLSDKAEIFSSGGTAPSQNTSPGIKWKTLNDSDEETSEGYDEMDEDTDEDSNDKPGMSDTETKNLLEDVIEDEEDSDVEDSNTLSSEIGRASKQIQDKTSTESLADSLYGMSEEQKAYYTKCFNHLMKKTVGHYDINGAVCGANEHVVEFFKRSGLDREKLSKIWSLSDVNEDGYLDLNEFSTAMHLIVLHIKGQVPIPDVIPFEIRPPIMPRRDAQLLPVSEEGNNKQGAAHAASIMHDWKQFDFDDAAHGYHSQQYHSLSDDHLYVQPANEILKDSSQDPPERLSTFSDVPPLLVDGRPTALKATQPLVCTVSAKTEYPFTASFSDVPRFALSPQGPKGPPPKPPPRPVNKGHGRSASLDMNTFLSSTAPGLKHNLAAEALQRGATLPAQTSLRYHPCNSMPADTACFSSTEWRDPNSSPRHLPAPPLPPRATFVDVSVQTENSATSSRSFRDGRELIELNIDMEKRIEELLSEEGNANASSASNSSSNGSVAGNTASTAQMNWRERCDHLRKLNAHLEAERAKLAQIRLQLELRLQEATGNQPSMKPTSL